MNTEGLMLHAHILELLMITLEICVYIHVEIQIHSSQVQDFLCLLWYSWPGWCKIILNSLILPGMESIVLIGIELGIFYLIGHLFLYLFPMEASNEYLTSEVPGQENCYSCISCQLLTMLQRKEQFDARRCTSFRVWIEDEGFACPDQDGDWFSSCSCNLCWACLVQERSMKTAKGKILTELLVNQNIVFI